jgi:soluble lytic murein transglycosylase-like protein
MKALVAASLVAAPAAARSQPSGDPDRRSSADPDGRRTDNWDSPIREASDRFDIPEDWIRRVIRAESGARTRLGGRPITSRAGAMGLMQLMPSTWADMRLKNGLGPDPHDPRDNIIAGTAYLRAMYDRFGYPGLFAA